MNLSGRETEKCFRNGKPFPKWKQIPFSVMSDNADVNNKPIDGLRTLLGRLVFGATSIT